MESTAESYDRGGKKTFIIKHTLCLKPSFIFHLVCDKMLLSLLSFAFDGAGNAVQNIIAQRVRQKEPGYI